LRGAYSVAGCCADDEWASDRTGALDSGAG